MADRPVAAVAPRQPGQQNQPAQNGGFGLGGILRLLVVFWLIKSFFGGSRGPPANAPRHDFYWPKFNRSEPIDFSLYLSESAYFNDVLDTSKLIWAEQSVALATEADRTLSYLYRPSKASLGHVSCLYMQRPRA